MKRVKSALLGGARVRITGRSLERLLTKVVQAVPVFAVERSKHDVLILSVDFKNLNKLFAIIDKTCYNVEVIKSWGLLPALSGWKRRIGLIAAGGAVIGAFIAFSLFVWRVDVSATDGSDTAPIVEYLAGRGVRAGAFRGAVDVDELERELYLNFPNVSFVSCSKAGVSVRVSVVKSLAGGLPGPKEGEDILSRHEGVISRVIVESGTALVKPGDRVNVGDALIGGYVESETERRAVPALGQVYLTQIAEYTEVVPLKREVRARTGKYVDVSVMHFFGAKFPMKGEENTFSEYDTEQFSYYPFQWNLLPIRVDVTRCYEVVSALEDINFESGKNIYYEYAVQNALSRIEGSYTEINRIIEDRREGDSRVIEVLLQIERLTS